MYAVVRNGGHQYRVSEGETIKVQLLGVEAGSSITLDEVLLISGKDAVRVGTPLVEGASVTATVLGDEKGEKLTVFKYKPKKRYRIKTGHRQSYTRLRIDAITG
jgi:large subunit ribosomal protein L21